LFFISFCPMRKMMNVLKLPCFKMHFITCTMLILQNLIFFFFLCFNVSNWVCMCYSVLVSRSLKFKESKNKRASRSTVKTR
jgi:hypothetical protein